MIYEKPAASLHIFSVQPSGGIYPSYTITGINNGVANEPGQTPRDPSGRNWGHHTDTGLSSPTEQSTFSPFNGWGN